MTEVMLGSANPSWPVYRLGQLFRERKEKVNDRDFPPLSVTKNGIVPQLETAAKSDDSDNRKGVYAGDFVINSRSDRKGSSGLSELDGSVSLINIVLEPQGIHPKFAHHLLRSSAFQEEFYRWGHGIVADLWTTRYSDMKGIRVAIPDLNTQKAIAAYLDRETARIDKLIAKKERQLTLVAEKFDALVSVAVTKGLDGNRREYSMSGVDYLGTSPKDWDIEPLGRRYSIQLGKMLDASRQTGEHLAPYLRVADVQWDEINVEDLPLMDFSAGDRLRFNLLPGDLLVNEGGSYVGRSAIWRGQIAECFYQKALHRVRPRQPERDSAEFLLWLMWFATKQGVFVARGNQTTIDHLTAEALRRYRFAFPPA